MGLLRSEVMKSGMLVLPQNEGQARKYLDKLGQDTSMQFEDMNSHSGGVLKPRPYRHHVQRLDEMERILRFVYSEADRLKLKIVKNKVDEFLQAQKQAENGDIEKSKNDSEKPYKMDQVEAALKQWYGSYTQLKDNDSQLIMARNQVAEEIEVLEAASKMMGKSRTSEQADDARQPLMSRVLKAVAGVINQDQQVRFARTIWRATRQNSFAHFIPIQSKVTDPKTGAPIDKCVFVIFFQGAMDSKASFVEEKVKKLCATFGTNNYPWPDSAKQAMDKLCEQRELLNEKEGAIAACEKFMGEEFDKLLSEAGGKGSGRGSVLEEWRFFCTKEKYIYATLNMFEERKNHLQATCWWAAEDDNKIEEMIKTLQAQAKDSTGGFLSRDKALKGTPPTYVRTNQFTDVWQTVINTYGVPRYQEANPALFTVVTFPFIFGMMYGDVGHGLLVMLAGVALIYKGDSLLKIEGIGETLHWARFLIFQLGFYALFAGLLYNDMFSVGLQLFDTRFTTDSDGNYVPGWDDKNEGGDVYAEKGGPYPFGVDWAWHGATNELLFMNSLKMKLSVLFGVLQMTMGLFLRCGNAIYFKSKIDFFCECIPCMIFMLCFFGWMDFMILYKWVHSDAPNGPPGIINALICMAMGPMGIGQEDTQPLWDSSNGGMSSTNLALSLMNLAMLSVPWLLLPKPFFLFLEQRKKEKKEGNYIAVEDEEAALAGDSVDHGEHDEGMGEIIIHQIIETIEYVLGTVSHTASYLRIWALSLAHQQLSEVFFQKTIAMALPMTFPMNGILIYVMFTVWFAITCAVLLGMDVLECFLHTLRLHWVEFDSKFFKADGYAFEPFDIRKAIADSNA